MSTRSPAVVPRNTRRRETITVATGRIRLRDRGPYWQVAIDGQYTAADRELLRAVILLPLLREHARRVIVVIGDMRTPASMLLPLESAGRVYRARQGGLVVVGAPPLLIDALVKAGVADQETLREATELIRMRITCDEQIAGMSRLERT